jgi:predicted signal transduction protein with EAL and GGDEF domain
VRGGDVVARLGGDEFAVLLVDLPETEVGTVAERLLRAVAAPVVVDGHELLVRASIGIADEQPGDDAADLLRRADIAMYAAKDAGKGRWARHADSMAIPAHADARHPARPRPAGLPGALPEDQFELYYQPIVDLPGGRISGAEAVPRWRHPERGLLAAAQFLPRRGHSAFSAALGSWMIARACAEAAGWSAVEGGPAPGVAVTLSSGQLRDPHTVTVTAEALRRTGLPPDRLTIGVAGAAAVGGQPAALAAIEELRGLGVRVALDDFGTGAAPLNLMTVCRVDELWLHPSCLPDPGRSDVAAAVAHLAGGLGLDLVARGVRTREEAEALSALGYRRASGRYHGEPVPAAELTSARVSCAAAPAPG